MNAAHAARPIPPALMQEAPTLGQQLDAAHEAMLTELRVMLDHKAIYREQLAICTEARKRFFDACERFNAAQATVSAIAKEARTVSA